MPLLKYATAGLPAGRPGDRYGDSRGGDLSGVVAGGQSRQITTITITAANDTEYSLGIEGVTFTTTSDADGTKAEVANAFVALINADEVISGLLVASEDSGDLVLTGRQQAEFEVDDADSNLSASTVALADADVIPFGSLAMLEDSADGERIARLPGSDDDDGSGNLDSSLRYGVALREETQDPSRLGGVAGYGPNANGTFRSLAMAYVRTEAEITPGNAVYVRQSGSGDAGDFADSSGAGLIVVPDAKWVRAIDADTAILELV